MRLNIGQQILQQVLRLCGPVFMLFLVNQPVHLQNQVVDCNGHRCRFAVPVRVDFFNQAQNPGLDGVKPVRRDMIDVLASGGGLLHEIDIVRRLLQQLLHIILADPEDKAPVGLLGRVQDEMVLNAGRNQNQISHLNGKGLPPDLHRDLSLYNQIKLIIVVGVRRNRIEVHVTVIEDLKIPRDHMLSCVERRAQLISHGFLIPFLYLQRLRRRFYVPAGHSAWPSDCILPEPAQSYSNFCNLRNVYCNRFHKRDRVR